MPEPAEAMETQEPKQAEEPKPEEHMFTQAELNQVVKERVARERAKFQGFDELKEKATKADELSAQLQKAQDELQSVKHVQQVSEWKSSISKETGIPAEALKGDTQEELQAHADTLKKYFNPGGVLKDQANIPETKANSNASYIHGLLSGE